jgi:hypothetical protein
MLMSELTPDPLSLSTEGAPRARRARPAVRRAADRHYLGVVAAEARRLSRQLRSPRLASASARRANLDPELAENAA